jgi:hypothetical protein
MSETVYVRGGFGSGTDHLSPTLAARVLAADAAHDRQAARDQQAHAERIAARQEADVVLSIRMAQERGEVVDVRKALRDGGVGHERREFVELASARMDVEDAQERAREQARYRKFLAEGEDYGDTSAPTAAEVAEHEVMVGRAEKFRAGKRERGRLVRNVLAAARMDDSR